MTSVFLAQTIYDYSRNVQTD